VAGPVNAEQLLLPGTGDATRLSLLWLVRRACTGLLFLGVVVGIVIEGLSNDAGDLKIDTGSADSVLSGILTAFGLVFVAIVLRLVTGWVGLVLAHPLARQHQGAPEPRLRRRLATYVDRYSIVRAFRELRWTEGVRTAALRRLGDAAQIYERVDRTIGIANLAIAVLCVPAILLFGFTIEM
jgi:hypothetical protein